MVVRLVSDQVRREGSALVVRADRSIDRRPNCGRYSREIGQRPVFR